MIGNCCQEFVALVFIFVCSAAVSADLCTVAGVSGDGCPDLRFNETTGIVTFNADGSSINSLLITGPDPGITGLLDPDGNWPVASDLTGTSWQVVNSTRIISGTYSHFADKYQNIMFSDSENRGWDNAMDLAIIQYPVGTTLGDFGQVEMLTWDTDVTLPPASQILFTEVVAIPEPSGWLLVGVVLLKWGLVCAGHKSKCYAPSFLHTRHHNGPRRHVRRVVGGCPEHQ